MPYYLVTQSSLIEADNEQAAAQKVVDRLRTGVQLQVSVKSDETTLSHVIVAGKGVVLSEQPATSKQHYFKTAEPATSDERGGRTSLRRLIALARMKGRA